MARTFEELGAAVESLFRVRAVESPPDEQGVRRIWHLGLRGAQLVTDLDSTGEVKGHTLTLFDEVISWDEAGGLSAPTPASLKRAAAGLQTYAGSDRLLQHLRGQLVAKVGATRTGEQVQTVAVAALGSPTPRWLWLVVAAALLVVGVFLAVLVNVGRGANKVNPGAASHQGGRTQALTDGG